MRKLFFVISLSLFASPALAQVPAFVPFTVNEQGYNQLQQYLGEQPYKFARPLMDFLQTQEQQAQAAAKAAEKPKAPDAQKP